MSSEINRKIYLCLNFFHRYCFNFKYLTYVFLYSLKFDSLKSDGSKIIICKIGKLLVLRAS